MNTRLPVKLTDAHKAMLNLGCGLRTSWEWNNIDFSAYARLRRHPRLVRFLRRSGILSDERYQRLLRVDPDIVAWDVRRGIPFPSDTFDVVYHAHLLEHLDRNFAPTFLKECYRVLKKGGIIRVVVPNLELICRKYVASIGELDKGNEKVRREHDDAVDDLFAQMVRPEPGSRAQQKAFVRFLERLTLGDAGQVGEMHRWMYDRHSLKRLLEDAGFRDIQTRDAFTSGIENWTRYYLDASQDGRIQSPHSLYMEGVK